MSDNDWKASLDSRIGEFPHLRTLSLERSKLMGSIPKTLQNLSDLGKLHSLSIFLKLSHWFNNISRYLTIRLCVENLLLHNNDVLYGEILDILSPLSNLGKKLSLHNIWSFFMLIDKFWLEISLLDNAVNVDCYGNDFFGSIPTSIGTWSNLG